MKKFALKFVSMAFVWIMCMNAVMACTAAPKADVSKPEPAPKPNTYINFEVSAAVPTQKEDKKVNAATVKTATKEKTEEKQEERSNEPTPFVIDNFKVIQNALCKLGISNEELEVMIKEGKKLPEVLEMRNIKVERFKKALLKQYYAAINEGVKNKQITKEEGKMLRIAIKAKVMSWLTTK
ncbi:hypothetical protein PBV87_04260 [Niameybacter massiliensis]|uniref:Lipoprotein n=1 Tax=Holtiella tumoricola TaxID=3018743 RepID=A0AA42J043_9FIRM|nr:MULTISPECIES: hypothetical protein [Lachnospirales]MDA3730713.1 hypothetical protein [Holtiella tumoricola]